MQATSLARRSASNRPLQQPGAARDDHSEFERPASARRPPLNGIALDGRREDIAMTRSRLLALLLATTITTISVGGGYWFVADRATAQGAAQLVDLAWRQADGRAYALDTNGIIYSGPGLCGPFEQCGQLPSGCSPVCFLDGDVGASLDIGCANGDIFTVTGAFPSVGVSLCTNVFGAKVSTERQTWGNMKSRMR